VEVADNEHLQSVKMTPEIERYLSMWERDPKSRVFAPLAESYRKIGQLDRAIEICEKGLQIHPNYVSGRVALGRAYFEKGDYESAKTHLEMVFEADPENLVAAKTLGEIYEEEKEYEKALLCYRLAHYTTPSAVEITEKIKSIEEKLSIKEEESPTIDDECVDERERDIEDLKSSIAAARCELRKSEALEAGEEFQDDGQESENAIHKDLEKDIKSSKVLYEEEEEDEITLEMDVFFSESVTSTTGGISDYQVRGTTDSMAMAARDRRQDLMELAHTELMLRMGYFERAVKVYREFLDSEPDNEQAARRVVEVNEQLEDIRYEIHIREGEPGRKIKEEEVRKEVAYTLVDWLQRIKTIA